MGGRPHQVVMSTPPLAIDVVMRRMRSNGSAPAVFHASREYSYDALGSMIDRWTERLAKRGVSAGEVCSVIGDFSPEVCALLFALIRARAIIVPLSGQVDRETQSSLAIAGVRFLYRFDATDRWSETESRAVTDNPMVVEFRERAMPGLVVFTSGSTGKPKGILHDCERVMRKFISPREGRRTVLFLSMDHFGGFNTFLSTFAYGGVGLCIPRRTMEDVCRLIDEGRAELLPTTPTFLNLLAAGGLHRSFDLSSIRMITYGTEVMSRATLARIREIFPRAVLKQTYGLSELGVLRSKSQSDESLWVKVGGDGFDVKVVDGVLWVRSEANMVGYLNAPSPFDEEGWLCTDDRVEVRGEYVRFLGRESDLINVGGQKVFPAEIESVLLAAENVWEAAVYGVKHPIMGSVVHANVSLEVPEDPQRLSERLRAVCLRELARYKVPIKFHIVPQGLQHSERFKKLRGGPSSRDGDSA